MSAQDKGKLIDPTNINVIDHLLIRDKDTGQVLINKRDIKVIKNDDKR